MVAVSTGGCLLASDYLSGVYFHDSNYYAQHGWPKLAAFWAAAGIVQIFVPRNEEVLAGAANASTRRSVLREQDGLFFVPIKYWPLILLAAGILFYFVRD
jgi:hypothetical protein